jgi:hypothetical protein
MDFDNVFMIGSTHKVCEDYSISSNDGKYFGISDGCSSSKNSDIGSRLNLKAFERIVEFLPADTTQYPNLIWSITENIIDVLGLSDEVLDATILTGYLDKNVINVDIIGDGVVFAQKKDGTYELIDIDYSDNAPYYLTYFYNQGRNDSYKKVKQIKKVTTTIFNSVGSKISTTEIQSEKDYEKFFFPIEEYKSVNLFSDGVKTFSDKETREKVELIELLLQLTTFPVPSGEFVKRKIYSYIKKNPNINFSDDFSMATCYIG